MIPFSCFTSKNEIGKNSNDKISNEKCQDIHQDAECKNPLYKT